MTLIVSGVAPCVRLCARPCRALCSSSFHGVTLCRDVPFGFMMFVAVMHSVRSLVSSVPISDQPEVRGACSSHCVGNVSEALLGLRGLPTGVDDINSIVTALGKEGRGERRFVPCSAFLSNRMSNGYVTLVHRVTRRRCR